jgi:hypothetical protein
VTGGGGSQAAHEAFPNSDIAPFIGGIVGGGVPFVMPVRGRVTSGFGEREAPIAGASTYHQGIDIAVPSGTPVKAPEAGVISRIGADRKAGRWVEIDHGDGLKTKYLHLGEIHGKVGDEVSPGDVFAKSGATGNVTGPHLHWAAFKDGKPIDPRTLARDPARPPAHPMEPAEIADAMGDPEAGVQAETDFANSDGEDVYWDSPEGQELKRQEARTIGDLARKHGLDWDTAAKLYEDGADFDGPKVTLNDNFQEQVLTPAEKQEMDASVDKPVVDNTGYERFTPNPEEKTPANDPEELIRDQNPPAMSDSFGTAPPEGVNREDPTKGLKDHVPKFLLKKKPPEEEVYDEPAPEVTPEDVGPVARLRQALEEARPLRGEQDRAVSRERAKRFQAASDVGKYTSGEEGFYAELSKLKGKMPTKEFESLRDNLHQSEIDELTDVIKNHPRISYAESTTARRGLLRIIDGEVPTKGQMKLLGEIFPKDILDTVSSKKPDGTTLASIAADVLNTPRALMASFDVSAPGRQGVFLIGSGPFWTNLPKMFKGLISEKNYTAMNDAIAARPTYPLMKRAGLALTNVGRNLSEREEQFMSRLAEKIPGIGKIVRASDRAYSAYLNGLRADTFDNLLRLSKEAGVDFKENPKALKDISRFVNAATGRGDLGKLNQAAPLLSGLFFSPRLMASRVSLLNPAFYIRLSPVVRQYAIRNLLSFAGIATLTLGLAKLGGANITIDPRSTDFGKIRINNTRLDILGGFQSYIRAFAQLITGQTVNPDTKKVTDLTENKYGGRTRRDVVMTFFENKFSPVAGLVDNLLSMTHDKSGGLVDKYGNKTSIPKSVAMDFVPMIVGDTYQATQDLGTKGILTVVPNAFGIGVQSYQPKPHKDKGSKKKDPFDFNFDFGAEKKSKHKESGDFGDAF